jgi:hypothetical protein
MSTSVIFDLLKMSGLKDRKTPDENARNHYAAAPGMPMAEDTECRGKRICTDIL